MTATDTYAGLVRTLRDIASLVPPSRRRWDGDRTLRLAAMKLWIDAGNYAEAYRRGAGHAAGVQPWSSLVGYRGVLAHQLPEDLNPERLWLDVVSVGSVLDEVLGAGPLGG